MQIPPLSAALASILLSVGGQVALKVGTSRAQAGVDAILPTGSSSFIGLLKSSLLQPAVVLGLMLYAAGAVLWIYVLARWDLSKAYPLLGLGFVLTMLIGVFMLGERATLDRWIGCALVLAGMALIVRS